MTRSNASELRRCANLFVALLMSWALVLTGGGMRGYAYADEVADDGAEGEEYSLEELAAGYSDPSDADFLTLTANAMQEGLEGQIDTSQYYVEGVTARYISQEYLDELAYNSQSNVYFGYTLAELDAEFQGTRYVFDLGDDGQTEVHEFEAYTDEYAQMAGQIASDVAVGTGVIMLCAVLAPVTASLGAATPVVAFFYLAATEAPAIALTSAAIGGAVSGVMTGVSTGSVTEGLKAAATGAANEYKWGAVIGAAASGAVGAAVVTKYEKIIKAEEAAATAAAESVAASGDVILTAAEVSDGIRAGKYTLQEVSNCRNAALAGLEHPETGVKFAEKYILQEDGVTVVKGVFPKFESTFTTKLPKSMYTAENSSQFAQCTADLAKAVESDASLAEKFSAKQLEQIAKGDIPSGYTWHHNEEEGIMQLVDTATHAKTGHTGGNAIWGHKSVATVAEAAADGTESTVATAEAIVASTTSK